MSEIELIAIGKRIKNRRKQLGYTQEQLSEMMGVSVQMVSNLERGNKAIRIDNLIHLSHILNISTDFILTGKHSPSDLDDLSEQISALSRRDKKMIEWLVDYCASAEESDAF